MKNTLITLSNYLATNKKAARVAKVLSFVLIFGVVAAAFSTTVLASTQGVDLSGAYKPIVTLINSFVTVSPKILEENPSMEGLIG